VCTLYPQHIDTTHDHWCSQFRWREYSHTYEAKRELTEIRENYTQQWNDIQGQRREIKRLEEVAKGLRRKLKEERAKK